MKYMLVIHQGATPTPPSEEWDNLSEGEKGAIYGAYKGLRSGSTRLQSRFVNAPEGEAL